MGDGDFNLDGLSAATTGRETRSVYGQNVFGSFEPPHQLGLRREVVRSSIECPRASARLRGSVLAHVRRIPSTETKKLDRIVWNASAVMVTPGTTSRIVWA